jgi:parvulin-like peptidyl-prolyl isomerase
LKRYLFAAIVLALLGAGCSGGGNVAATVNGTDLDVETIEGLINPLGDEMTDEQFQDALTAVVQWTAIEDAAQNDFEISPTDEEILEYSNQILAAQGQGASREQFLETQQVTEEGFLLYAAQLLVGERVIGQLSDEVVPPTPEEAQELFNEDPQSWTLVCAAHILVETEEEAAAIQARLDDGEDFAALATELSTDPGSGPNGGDLGCSTPVGYVDEFAEATMTSVLGEIAGPVQTQFGFHLIRVDSRTEATTEELSQALTEIRLADVVDGWYLGAVTDADVTIAEEYGTWELDPVPTIVPPLAE